MFIHREGKRTHAVARSLCDRTLMRCGATAGHRVGHCGVSGWWQPREGGPIWVGWGKDVGMGAGSQHS